MMSANANFKMYEIYTLTESIKKSVLYHLSSTGLLHTIVQVKMQ